MPHRSTDSRSQLIFNYFVIVLLLLLHLIPQNYIAQKNTRLNNVTLYKGDKRINLNTYDEFNVIFHKTSQGQDSISTEIFCKEIRARRDTLFVRPTDVTTFRLMDTIRPYSESKYYPENTNIWFNIPAKEIEYIKAKKQPINRISSTVLSVSYVTLLCSPFIAMSENADVSNFGINLFLASVPVLVLSWSCNAIWGKKTYRMDPRRTRRDIWELSK